MEALIYSDIQNLHDRLEKDGPVVIVTHTKPDGDAMGSSIAMYSFLRMMGRSDMNIVLSDCYPDNLSFMIGEDASRDIIIHERTPREAEEAITGAGLIICLDFNAFHRTDRLENVLVQAKAEKVLIDHHLHPDSECFSITFSRTEVSSASELLYHILMRMPEIGTDASRLPEDARTALLTGMTTDTNNLSNSVYPLTLAMASALLEAGTDRDFILYNLYNRFSESRLRLMGHMMKDLMKITPDGVAYIVLDSRTQKQYNVAEGDTEGFVNMPLSIEEVKMSLLLKEDGDRVRVSIRSKKGTSANRCATGHFNGGGHENASGGRLYIGKDIGSIGEAADYIEKHTHIFMTEENEK